MEYTQEEKLRIDRLVEAFQDFIREQNYFDIVYSEKLGYLRVIIQENEDDAVMRLDGFDTLLKSLIDDMLMEAEEAEGCVNKAALRTALAPIFDRMGADSQYCKDLTEAYLTNWEQG